MAAKRTSWLAWLWIGGLATSVSMSVSQSTARGGEASDATDCVMACVESAIDGFGRCRELGGTVAECSEAVESDFTLCAGERGCQGACADGCLAETSSAYAACLDDGIEEEECASVAREVAQGCYPACPTSCELTCTLSALLGCLSEASSPEDCAALSGDDLTTCTAECAAPGDKDEDGIPNDFDRCGFNRQVVCGTADAGGPYIVSPATGIHLDGGGSFLPGAEEIVEYSWDLNADGVFGDATGVRPEVSIAQFLGVAHSMIGLRVTDDRGLSDTAFAEFALSDRSFTVDDARVAEGDEGTRDVALTVRLSQPVSHAVTVDYLTADGAPVSATLGKPFTWDDCSIWKILDLYDRNLLVHADWTPPHEGDFPAWPHPQGVYDSECRFYHWHNGEIDNLKGCGHSFAYQPDRHPHPATAGEDYVSTSGFVRFAPGQVEADIVIQVLGDTTFEPEEAFQVILRSPSIGALVDGVGVVTILSDGDVRPEDCSDGVDNNGDGLVDCDDPACAADAGCPQALREFIRCDATADGLMNVSDAIHMVRELFLGVPRSACREATDCNGDMIRDISDAVYCLAFSFGSGRAPPMPFPECGSADHGMGAGGTVDCESHEACVPGPGELDTAPVPSAD